MIPALFAGLSAAVAAAKALPGLARAIKSVFSPTRPSLEVSPSESDKYVVFTYDKLGELIGVNLNQTPTESFTFDKSGNLTSLTSGGTTTSLSYNSLNQQTSPAGKTFDAKGQTTTDGTRTYEWDDQGRITAVVQGTQRSEFSYDGDSRRTKISEFTNGTITSKKLYFWLGGSIVCERDGLQTGFPITKQYFGQGEVRGATKLHYTFDHLGSIRELVDAAGTVQAEYRYSTYGEQTKVSGNLDSDWGYAGLWHHQASGLDLATYRAYDAANKRWISRDPLGEGVDANLYRYCKNSPVGCLDPEGLDPLNSAQTANVNAAINVVNQVDPATSTGLAGLLQSGDIYQSGPTVSKFARGFTPTGSIGISPDWLSADPILLSVLLVHEYEHVKQERCGKWNKRFQIVLYLVTGFQINRDLELPAYNAQQDYMRKLRTIGTLHPSTSVQSQLNSLYEEGATRIENLRLWGQIDSGL